MAVIVLLPEDCTVTTPEELLTIKNACPNTSVDVTGSNTVWVVLPVKNCWYALNTVRVVVPAPVAVVAYPSIWLLADKFLLASHPANAVAAGAVVTDVTCVPPLAIAMVVPVHTPLVIVPKVVIDDCPT